MLFTHKIFNLAPWILALLSLVGLGILYPPTTPLLVGGEIAASIIVLVSAFVVLRIIKFLSSNQRYENKIGVVFCAFISVLFIVVDWPGMVSVDDLYLLESILGRGKASGWQSISYSLITEAFVLLSGSIFYNFVFSFILFANLLILVFSIAAWSWKQPLYWLLLFVLVMPQTSALVFFQNRDSIYSLILLNFIFVLLSTYVGGLSRSSLNFISLVIMAIVLGDLRQEGKIITLLAPFLICFSYKENLRMFFRYSVFVYIFALVYFVPFSIYQGTSAYSSDYQVTAFVNPLNYILHKEGFDSLSESEKEAIDKVFDLKKLSQYKDPYDIYSFHDGGLRSPLTKEDFKIFKETSIRYIIRNFPVYLENRWLVFTRMFNFDRVYSIYNDALRVPQPDHLTKEVRKSGKDMKGESYTLSQQWAYDIMDYLFSGIREPFHFIFASSLIPLFALILIALNYRRHPFYAFLAGVILVRSFVVITLAPAAYFKYIASTWVAGWLLGIIYFKLNYLDKRKDLQGTDI